MSNALWIAKTGLEAQQNRLSVVSNNLANVNTTGYRYAWRVFMFVSCHNGSSLLHMKSKDKEYLMGVRYKETEFCLRCFETLTGLEDYFDNFYTNFLNKKETKTLIRKLYNNEQMLDEAMDIRGQGKLFSISFVEKIKKLPKLK